ERASMAVESHAATAEAADVWRHVAAATFFACTYRCLLIREPASSRSILQSRAVWIAGVEHLDLVDASRGLQRFERISRDGRAAGAIVGAGSFNSRAGRAANCLADGWSGARLCFGRFRFDGRKSFRPVAQLHSQNGGRQTGKR